ncbi:hypothetical protein [Legionella sainthelensi]|uniref:hypothetical protein n=1 Tax=Legionella sainthelensi TaxID=28087 RepID=UPI00216513EA|nr:hypothetical protein [Legionella sainthelensi]
MICSFSCKRGGIPIYALAVTSLVAAFAFLSSIFGNGTVYFWLLSATSFSGFIAWMGIAISHYRFRKAYLYQGKDLTKLPYLAKECPFGLLCALSVCFIVLSGQNYSAFTTKPLDWSGLIISYSEIPLFPIIWIVHKWVNKTKIIPLVECNFD